MNRRTLFLSLAILLAALLTPGILAGSIVRFLYEGDSTASSPTSYRQSISTLTNWTPFPNSPTFREQLDDFFAISGQPLNAGLQGKDNSGTDYGSWIRGYLEAPATGDYRFSVASADNSEFWLSPNHLATGAILIAYEPGTGESLFTGNRLETRVSAPIHLDRARKYYLEVRHQHGAGAGYIQVGWQRPDGVQEIIPALHLAQYEDESTMDTYGGFVNLAGSAPLFNNSANTGGLRGGYLGGDLTNSVAVDEGSELLLPMDVIAPEPTTFVWTTNGVVVADQNLSYFQLEHTPSAYNGLKIQAVVSNAFGSLTSRVATVSVRADTVAPTTLTVDSAGNPNLVQVVFSEPVAPASATNVGNYKVTDSSSATLSVQSASLSLDQRTVFLTGTFNFQAGNTYQLRVQNVTDQATLANILTPNPSTASFTLSAPLGTTYDFESGVPANFRLFGNAGVTNAADAPSGIGILRLTDAARSQNGFALVADRRDIDQVHIRFKIRVADTGASVFTDEPWGDGFSVNIAGNLPLGTFANSQFGYSPTVPGPQLSLFFNAHENSVDQPVSIGIVLNGQVSTNILAGTNGIPLNGVPSISSVDGHWSAVDINVHRDGTLDLAFDGVTLLSHYKTDWVGVNSGQIGFAAGTRGWYETHWIDDLYINYGEGDVGNVGLGAGTILGGSFPENSAVRLVAAPTGAGPFSYQWFKNGTPVSGETNRIFSFTGTLSVAGEYFLVLSNSFSTFTSATHAVVIVPDTQPPALVSSRAIAGGVNQVVLTFDEPLDPISATTLSTYASPYFVVSSASLRTDGKSVVLSTTQQRVGAQYPIAINGLKDASRAGNALTSNITVSSSLTYHDEILADKPARYFKLDEAGGTVAFTSSILSDAVNTNGTYNNVPILGAPSLVPSAGPGEYAVQFIAANSNNIAIPNGGDINDFRGPWSKKSYELWFNAATLPIGAQPGDTAVLAQTHALSGLWEEGGNLRSIGLYVWNGISNSVPNTNLPSTALLTFHSYNSTADGPGAPYGLLGFPATYVTYPITTNITYHVVAVQDGDPNGTTGELRLYVNGELVSQLTNGVGQIYNHNGDVQIGRGNARSHLNVNGNWGYFDGLIDEVSTFNTALSEERIKAHYAAGLGTSTQPVIDPVLVQAVDHRGNPNGLNIIFNQSVSPDSAAELANYTLQTAAGAVLPISSARLEPDLKTVTLSGNFNFVAGGQYGVSIRNVADILAPANKLSPTNVSFGFVTAGPVKISSDIGDQITVENQPVRFSVAATGQPPFSYQWRRNGQPIPGETNAVISIVASLSSAGQYTVAVGNAFSSANSSSVSLVVNADTLPPQIAAVRALAGTLNEIRIRFSKPITGTSATNVANYQVNSGGLAITGASLSEDGLEATLQTTVQSSGETGQVTVSNIKDLAATPNNLTATASFVSGVSYRDEVLGEGAVRYWTFDETSGTEFDSLVANYDTDPLNIVGKIIGAPKLEAPGLVPNASGTAITFSRASRATAVDLPNSKDLNAILGPWSKLTHLFAFKANTLPRAFDSTNSEAPAIYGHSSIVIYLQGTQDTNNPTEASLIFKAQDTASEGPGTPWGGNTPQTAKYVSYPVKAGQTYFVAAVLDGNASFSGQLKLYVNGTLVGAASGVGEIYKHPNYPPAFAHSYFTSVLGTNYTIRPDLVTYPDSGSTHWADIFDGSIDEFAVINGALPATRIAQLYEFAQTPPANAPEVPASSFQSVRIENGALTLTWTGSGTLQHADKAEGPYQTVSASSNHFTEPVTGHRQGYFRLVP